CVTVTILLSQIHHQIYADSDSRLQPITERANQTINHLDSAHLARCPPGILGTPAFSNTRALYRAPESPRVLPVL
ncbi:hypothetical protein, partial [Ferrovum myxofaciens]|uniref:hypothetical protein n=1 Tax=Ferrovum myxofaciens TaxID=416213 RepID=UPI001F44DE78